MTLPSRWKGRREYKALVMDAVGRILDDSPADEFPPGPIVTADIKGRIGQMPRRVDRCIEELIYDGWLARAGDRSPNLRVRPPGIEYLYQHGFLRRYYRRPDPAAPAKQKIYALRRVNETQEDQNQDS